MRSDLHLDPDGLRAVAARVALIVDGLESIPLDPDVMHPLGGLPDGPALAAERERLHRTISHTRTELIAMHRAIRQAAAAAETADLDVARDLRQRDGDW